MSEKTPEARAIASLNDMLAELVAGLAVGQMPTRGWAFTVVQQLADHSVQLGFTPGMGEGDLPGWEEDA